jgi:hypothetical protein
MATKQQQTGERAEAQETTQALDERDIQQSTNGVSNNIPIQPTVDETPANIVLKLADGVRRGGVNVDGEDYVFDPKSKKQRKVRLLKGVSTIFVDEQKDIDKEYINRNKRTLEFANKVYTIPPHDKTAIQFAEICNSNIDNPNRFGVKPVYFTVWNPLKEAQLAEAEELKMLEAMQNAAVMPEDKMMRHAVYLKIPLIDELGGRAKPQAIRTLYMRKAKQQPQTFLDSAENPEVDISWAVISLVINGTIDLNKQANQAYWNDGGYITNIPHGEDATSYLVQYALIDGEQNRNFKSQILALSK